MILPPSMAGALEVKDASWCSHLKVREGYRKQEKNTLVRGQNSPARIRVFLKVGCTGSASRADPLCVILEVLLPAKAEGQSD